MANEPLVVQAIYSYKRSNNDELCFKKGDIITVTQKDDGWWEGTLNGETGWFPSNYVKECKDAPKPIINQQNQYKSVVLKDLIDSEKAHVTELEGLVTNFLQPLEKSSILTCDEYKQLTGNITEVLETHQQLLNLIEIESNKPGYEQKVGKLFLTWAPRIKNVHQTYCSLHPRAVCILDKYREDLTKYMESKGATSPGVLVLTTMLSKPFRRLDKYSGMMQELERHVEECHPDRGDTQRSVSIYKDIASSCSATRRQKELELQVLTGPVRGWEGPSLTTLGDIIYMGSVAVGPQHHDRYFVLFPSTLVILSVSHRLSAFIYEGKLFLSGLMINRLEDTDQYKNAFEISAPMIDKRVAVCQSKEEADHWVELLCKHMPRSSTASNISQKVSPSQAQFVPQPPPHTSPLVAGGVTNHHSNRQGGINTRSSTPTPQLHHGTTVSSRGWSSICLRPTPPLRPCLALGTSPNGPYSRYSRKPMSYKEDGLILDVIEAYCSVTKLRSTVNSVELLTGGNVQMHDKIARSHRSSLDLIRSSSTIITQPLQPHNYRPHAQRASTWCCGSFVIRQLRKTQHLE
ncbi:rho guanine nucleotide exchange factor 7 isoform X2 [Leptinotarsa decemlineata]|uniref:rho guanine nucleotide exchange factor 7 isoform X2 n=1 Tax=Leptinotarsa decemlineata TaxID=7539 RepID=UPI000C25257F|nr:rho guanine nucleotide exchange factor 7 isoform X2 [Leptinotarsa decemlineata]